MDFNQNEPLSKRQRRALKRQRQWNVHRYGKHQDMYAGLPLWTQLHYFFIDKFKL